MSFFSFLNFFYFYFLKKYKKIMKTHVLSEKMYDMYVFCCRCRPVPAGASRCHVFLQEIYGL
jgi:hypothetical protein